jgi:hypothetical protein
LRAFVWVTGFGRKRIGRVLVLKHLLALIPIDGGLKSERERESRKWRMLCLALSHDVVGLEMDVTFKGRERGHFRYAETWLSGTMPSKGCALLYDIEILKM